MSGFNRTTRPISFDAGPIEIIVDAGNPSAICDVKIGANIDIANTSTNCTVLGGGSTSDFDAIGADCDHVAASGWGIQVGDKAKQVVLAGNTLVVGAARGSGVDSVVIIGSNLSVGDASKCVICIGSYGTSVGDNCVDELVGVRAGVIAMGVNVQIPPYAANNIAMGSNLIVDGYNNIALSCTDFTSGGMNPASIDSDSGSCILIGNHNRLASGNNIIALGKGITATGGNIFIAGSGSSTSSDGAIIIGAASSVTGLAGMVFGSGATAAANQCVFGRPSIPPGSFDFSIHNFTVHGYNVGAGSPIDTLIAIDTPAAGSSGLTVVYNTGGVLSNKTLKAALAPPGGSLLCYLA
jgi:hypothetical protein